MAKRRLLRDHNEAGDDPVYVKVQRAITVGLARSAVNLLTLPAEKFARAMELIIEIDDADEKEGAMQVCDSRKESLDELAKLLDKRDEDAVELRDLRKNPPSE